MSKHVQVTNPFHTIDVHQHTLLKSTNREMWPQEIDADCATRCAVMDEGGIDQAILFPGNSLLGGATATDRDNNEYLAAYRARHRERFPWAFASVDPTTGDSALRELEYAWHTLKLDGFVWHHRTFGVSLNHACMEPLWQLARDLKAPVAVHILGESRLESPWRLQDVAERYPEIQFIAVDGFSNADHSQWMPLIARHHPNILFDTGAMFSAGSMLEAFVKKLKFEPRLVFGSDYYPGHVCPHPCGLIEILDMEVSDEVKAAALGGTIAKVLAPR